MKKYISLVLLAGMLLAQPLALAATQGYPNAPVHLIVPFPPGGPTDSLARIIAEGMQAHWKQPVIVENKPGGGTLIGTDHVAKSNPDGLTIGMVISGFTINPSIRHPMPYDTLKDLTGVTQLAQSRLVLVANPSASFNTVPELIAAAHAHPGKLSYASPGVGTSTHLAGELFKNAADVDILHVPYKGSSPAQTDLIGGQVDMMFDLLQSAQPFVREGKLKIIAVASKERDPALAQYPAIAETLPGFEVNSMFGLVVPSGTPAAVVNNIRNTATEVLHSPKVSKTIQGMGMVIVASSPDDFNHFLRQEVKKWHKVVQSSGIKID